MLPLLSVPVGGCDSKRGVNVGSPLHKGCVLLWCGYGGLAARGGLVLVASFFVWVVFPVLFFRVSRSFFRSWRLLLVVWCFGLFLGSLFLVSRPALPAVFFAVLAAPVPFLAWLGLFLGLRRLLFVRLPRPALGSARWARVPRSSPWFGLARWCSPRWVCVPASAVPGWLALLGPGCVSAAVVRRRSGVLLFAWVLVPCCRRRGGWVPLFAPPVGGAAA